MNDNECAWLRVWSLLVPFKKPDGSLRLDEIQLDGPTNFQLGDEVTGRNRKSEIVKG